MLFSMRFDGRSIAVVYFVELLLLLVFLDQEKEIDYTYTVYLCLAEKNVSFFLDNPNSSAQKECL